MNKNKGMIGLGLIVAIVLGIAVVGGGAYYFLIDKNNKVDCCTEDQLKELNKKAESVLPSNENKELPVVESNKETKEVSSTLSSEESATENFKNQPGAIKSIKADGTNKWILAIDLLSDNPNWLPGNDSTGGFFLNKNTKIRNLIINNNTIFYNCVSQNPDYYSGFDNNSLSFINYVKDIISRKLGGEFGYTAYFDISGSNITAVNQQCLP